MWARIATFEGGDTERLRALNDERRASGTLQTPEGMQRVMVLQGDKRLFVSFFETREAIEAAEADFERIGDDIPEEVRGRRLSVDVYEVVWEGEA